MTYGSLHRFLLRTVASQGVLPLKEVNKLIEKCPDAEQNIQVRDIVKEINDEIREYQQEIKITNNEVTDEEVIVFMSLGYDETTKSQNLFSASELEFFRVLIEQIMTTESRQITAGHAMNLIKSLGKAEAQKLLNTWCRMFYLEKDDNNYALGVRAIHEFESYLRENMPDIIEECSLCKKIVFRGYNCPGCVLAIHTRCLKKYLEKVQKWPCCKIDFNTEQLEDMNRESSRLEQTQQPPTQQISETQQISPTQQTSTTQQISPTQQTSTTQQISPTQQVFTTQESMAYDDIDVPKRVAADVEMISQEFSEISQRSRRKRKRID